MTRERHRTATLIAGLAALSTLAISTAQAQTPSVQDFNLPPAPTPSPTAAGPVDSDHPVAGPTRAVPEAAPAPSPTIVLPSPAATPRAAPTPRAERPRSEAAPAPTPSPVETTAAPVAVPSAAPVAVETAPTPAPVAATPAPASTPWPWIAGGAALVLLAGGLLVWRRRRAAPEEATWEPAPAAEPAPSPPATLTHPSKLQMPPRAPAPTPAPAPASEFTPALPLRPLELSLEARHLSRAMVNASLAYRLTLTNHTNEAAGPLRIAGDILTAHTSLSTEEQLVPLDITLAPIHEVASLAPGESATLSGELRMPIADILPIQSGGGRVFVPLARFRAEALDGTSTTRVFVIGQTSEQPGGALRPFPLDRGPGVDRAIGQRELA